MRILFDGPLRCVRFDDCRLGYAVMEEKGFLKLIDLVESDLLEDYNIAYTLGGVPFMAIQKQ